MTPRGTRVAPAAVRRAVRLPLRLVGGEVVEGRVHTFDGLADGLEHLVVALGDRAARPRPGTDGVPLVRVHSECLTGDALGSLRCDCGPQLREAVTRIDEVGGYLVYLRQEGRGIGLYNKIDAYALQDRGLDTFEANEALGFGGDERSYGVAAQMLLGLGVDRVDLLTNNPDKAAQLQSCGVRVERCLPTGLHLTPVNGRYLAAKAWRGHRIPGLTGAVDGLGSEGTA
ncbi:GTP cyclohydrolase II [Nocardioides sp. GXQ0305]|uniref:GTP cyclohydrolase II n=1 Tax=Nocardioides sp. GXQ0305 TaxID=3423912 RepID=UPI003D7EC230